MSESVVPGPHGPLASVLAVRRGRGDPEGGGLRAPRGPDLHPGEGGRARAPDDAPVPVRGVLAQAEGGGGTDPRAAHRRQPLAQGADAASARRRCSTWRSSRTCSPPSARPPAWRGRTSRCRLTATRRASRSRWCRSAKRRSATSPTSSGPRGWISRTPRASRPSSRPWPCPHRGRRDRPAPAGFRHDRPPVPVHPGRPRAPCRAPWPGAPVHRAPAAQATEEHFRWQELVAVTDLASARQAIETIVEQGEGARGEWRDAHFGRLLGVLDEYLAAKRADPSFEPARPVVAANVRPPSTGVVVPLITDPGTARAMDLLNVAYEVLLQLLSRYFAHTDESPEQLEVLADVAVGLMYTVIKPLGSIVTPQPVGPDMPGSPPARGSSSSTRSTICCRTGRPHGCSWRSGCGTPPRSPSGAATCARSP